MAHVHGGLQRSECASSRQSQLLKDERWLQQRDIYQQTKHGQVCQRNLLDTWMCDTKVFQVFGLVLCSAHNDNEVSQECYDSKQSPRTPRTRKLMSRLLVWVLSVEEQQNVCGSKTLGGKQTKNTKAWLEFCILPPHSASRTALASPSEANHYICLLFFPPPTLNSCHPYLCSSTESSHWMQQFVVLLTERKCLW